MIILGFVYKGASGYMSPRRRLLEKFLTTLGDELCQLQFFSLYPKSNWQSETSCPGDGRLPIIDCSLVSPKSSNTGGPAMGVVSYRSRPPGTLQYVKRNYM